MRYWVRINTKKNKFENGKIVRRAHRKMPPAVAVSSLTRVDLYEVSTVPIFKNLFHVFYDSICEAHVEEKPGPRSL